MDMRDAWLVDAQRALIGSRGTTVTVTVAMPGAAEPLTFEATRDAIDFPPLVSLRSALLPDGVGYIALLDLYGDDLTVEFRRHLEDLRAQGATALVLDLRDNGGGAFRNALTVASEFAEPGTELWRSRSRGITSRLTSLSRRPVDLPLVVLVNARTVAVAEAVAASLQHLGRALVVGERTYGLAAQIQSFPLADGGEVTVKTGEWLLPDGSSIEGVGVTPDVWAPDARRPTTVLASGRGARAGQVVELSIDGVLVARAVATDEGFELVGVATGGAYEAATADGPDPAGDPALAAAVEAVKAARARAAE